MQASGIVDVYVDGTEALLHFGNGLIHLTGIGQVAGHGKETLELGGERRSRLARTGQTGDSVTVVRQASAQGHTQPGADTGNSLQAEDFGLMPQTEPHDGLSARLLGAEGEMILAALKANDGQRRRTARELGVSERTLRYKLQRLREQGVEV